MSTDGPGDPHELPGRRWVGLVALLFLAGCTGIPGTTEPARTTLPSPGPVLTSAAPSLPSTATPDLTCHELDARERNDVGRMNQTYHGVDPETGVVRGAAVEAGLDYSVIATRLTTGRITTWLAWVTDATVAPTGEDEVSYALHLAEITTDNWDGGPAPYGVQALGAARRCVT